VLWIPGLHHLLTRPATASFFQRVSRLVEDDWRDTLLDLGSGPLPTNHFNASRALGLDFEAFQENNVLGCDLNLEPIPFADRSIGIVTAYDFLEHIPRVMVSESSTRFPFVTVMSEIHRVLRPGGYFFSLTPTYPASEAFQDPTHVNIMSKKTFRFYFCGDTPWATRYGFIGRFEMIREGWRGGHRFSLLRKSLQ